MDPEPELDYVTLDFLTYAEACMEDEDLDVLHFFYGTERKRYLTDVQRISPVQFLRDRELGIRGTNERYVRQGVTIPCNAVGWYHHVKQKVYRWMLDKCKKEAENERRVIYFEPYTYTERDDYFDRRYWAIHVAQKIIYRGPLYIQILAGIGRCVELIVANINNKTIFTGSDNGGDGDGDGDDFALKTYTVKDIQNKKRYCASCKQVTCKCSVEECNVI